MGGLSSKQSPLSSISRDTPYVDQGIIDLCKTIKQAEYIFYLGAQLSRLVYCDTGIIQESLKGLGMHPDVFNEIITTYDWKYLKLRRSITKGVPAPDSYTTINQCQVKPTVKYISSPYDTTCIIVNPVAVLKNENSIILPGDCLIAFKGSSSLRNWIANMRSAKSGSLNEALKMSPMLSSIQANPDFKVTTSFLIPMLGILQNIFDAVTLVTPGCTRIFVFGHSKGGAEAEIMGMLLKLMLSNKNNFPAIASVTDIHVISYGAPKIIASSAYAEFDRQILSAQSTLTRIESVGRLSGDIVTTLPPWGVHPGVSEGSNTIDVVRGKYGVKVDGDYRRNAESWPFEAPFDLWSGTSANMQLLDQKVKDITKLTPPTEAQAKSMEDKTGGYYIKVKGARNTAFSHVEQLGMYFMGSQRLVGMKNPANTRDNKTFTANIDSNCSSYEYVAWTPPSGIQAVALPSETTGGRTRRKSAKKMRRRTNGKKRHH